ncbi:MAG: hypothetical protein HRT90_06310 [Candidatus Margulisbacteria bacterium]|nr:hypothetical protein [Candidatus Margulisiibacteriota bacterium]
MCVEQISKIEAVRRQLDTAIRLFFEDADTVSIHTLCGAAHLILYDIFNSDDNLEKIEDYENILQEEDKKKFQKDLRRDRSFFKHADRDMNETIEFDEKSNTLLLFMCTEMTRRMDMMSSKMKAYMVWFIKKNEERYSEIEMYKEAIKGCKLDPNDKKSFLSFANDLENCRDLGRNS